MSTRLRTLVAVVIALTLMSRPQYAQDARPASGGPGGSSGIGTMSTLPALGRNNGARAVNGPGTAVAGYSYDRRGKYMHAVRWTLQNGSWVLEDLPWPANATSTTARGVNGLGIAAGNDFALPPSPGATPITHAVLWPVSGGVTVLACPETGATDVYGISANAQVVVGEIHRQDAPPIAVVWSGGTCLVLPPLAAEDVSSVYAVNGDGTIAGGASGTVPVRWRKVAGAWEIEPLDTREGLVLGSNAAGDLVGFVNVLPCATNNGCPHAEIWYAAGGFRDLGTLGGMWSQGLSINSSDEVVGLSSLANGANAPFFSSDSTGMVQLAGHSNAFPFAVSDVRPDGTRLVVGEDGTRVTLPKATVWVVH